MKATTFDPTGSDATALLAPDAVILTVGALVNRILDFYSGPIVLVVDQVNGMISAYAESSGGAVDVAGAVADNASKLMQFEPGAINPTPFEGA